MTLSIAPYFNQQFFDNNGDPLSGGFVYTYIAGTTTAQATYTDATGATPNANPIVLDSAGRCSMFLSPTSYKFILKNSAAVTVLTMDGISAVPLTQVNLDILGTAGEALTMNQSVYLSDGSGGATAGRWYKTDADFDYSSSTAKEWGFVIADVSSGVEGTFRIGGRLTGLSGLTIGSDYYASATDGAITTTSPALSLLVGTADSTTSLIIKGRTVDASATTSGVVNITTQTFAGVKTFSSAVAFGALPTGIGAFLFSRSTANFTKNNNTTFGDVTGLSFAIGANDVWAFRFVFQENDAVATPKYTVTGPAAPTAVWFGASRNGATAGAVSAFGSTIVGPAAGGVDLEITIEGLVRNGANAGTVQMQMAQNAANASNNIIYADSYVMAWRVA